MDRAAPPAYNYRLPCPGSIRGAIKIAHGRHAGLPELCERFNQTEEWRLISPYFYKRTAIFLPDARLRPTGADRLATRSLTAIGTRLRAMPSSRSKAGG